MFISPKELSVFSLDSIFSLENSLALGSKIFNLCKKVGVNSMNYFLMDKSRVSLPADFTIVEEFEGEKEKVKSAHSLQLFRSRDKSYPPSLLDGMG